MALKCTQVAESPKIPVRGRPGKELSLEAGVCEVGTL